MALKGKPPTVEDKRLKLLLYSPAGGGKSYACTQMKKVYFIDTERGAQNDEYVANITQSGGAYLFLTTFDELLAEVKELMRAEHDYLTLVIDPLTVVYNDMIENQIKRLAEKERKDEDDAAVTAYGRPKQVPDRKMKHLLSLLTKLDMNVIITSHAKPKYDKIGDQFKEVGITYDCYSKLEYLFDLVLELQKRGKERYAVVRKTRLAGFPDSEAFKFSYDEIAERYGRAQLERQSHVIEFATPEQIERMNELAGLMLVPRATLDAWLEKAQADTWADMTTGTIAKCINYLETQKQKVENGQ